MSKRPEFTIAQITEQFEVSRSTVRRGLSDGRFPNAKKDHHGRWLILIDDVLQAGFPPRKTWLNEHGHEPGSEGSDEQPHHAQASSGSNDQAMLTELGQLKNELARERAQAEKLAALLEAEQAHVNSLRMALRMIEGSSSSTSPVEPSDENDMAESHKTPVYERHQERGFFSRFFRRR